MIRPVIEVGDCVKLRSGGQVMTVKAIADDQAICIWHDKMSRMRQESISIALLKVARAEAVERYGGDYVADNADVEAYRRSLGF